MSRLQDLILSVIIAIAFLIVGHWLGKRAK
jgi:hypothetical protein